MTLFDDLRKSGLLVREQREILDDFEEPLAWRVAPNLTTSRHGQNEVFLSVIVSKRFSRTNTPLGLGALLGSLGQVAVSHYSFETIELVREVMMRISRERTDSRGETRHDQLPETATYIIELHLRQLANESDRRFFNSVPTSLQLPSKTVDRLRELAARELIENREFRRLVRDLKKVQHAFRKMGRSRSYPAE